MKKLLTIVILGGFLTTAGVSLAALKKRPVECFGLNGGRCLTIDSEGIPTIIDYDVYGERMRVSWDRDLDGIATDQLTWAHTTRGLRVLNYPANAQKTVDDEGNVLVEWAGIATMTVKRMKCLNVRITVQDIC